MHTWSCLVTYGGKPERGVGPLLEVLASYFAYRCSGGFHMLNTHTRPFTRGFTITITSTHLYKLSSYRHEHDVEAILGFICIFFLQFYLEISTNLWTAKLRKCWCNFNRSIWLLNVERIYPIQIPGYKKCILHWTIKLPK